MLELLRQSNLEQVFEKDYTVTMPQATIYLAIKSSAFEKHTRLTCFARLMLVFRDGWNGMTASPCHYVVLTARRATATPASLVTACRQTRSARRHDEVHMLLLLRVMSYHIIVFLSRRLMRAH